ncbi:MAG: ATP-binding protein [Planctomycetes bacterium]|nr:ATP-binding protein [Planctomycetota bacterium]
MKTVAVSWSGGKDSAWMLHKLRQEPDVEVGCLITVLEAVGDNVILTLLHRRLIREQAKALGLPLRECKVVRGSIVGEYFALPEKYIKGLVKDAYTHIAYGDISSAETRKAREEHLEGTGLEALFPLWGRNDQELAQEEIDGGVKAFVVAIEPSRVDPELVGRVFDRRFLSELKEGVHACGEYGEFQTFAFDAPGFSAPLKVLPGDRVKRGERWIVELFPDQA